MPETPGSDLEGRAKCVSRANGGGGLLPLTALWAVSLYVLTPQLESELTHRVKTGLAKEMPWARTAIEGRDIIIEGAAPSDEAQRRAMRTAVETDGVRLAVNNAMLIPEARPFTWQARRDGGKVRLAGYVAADGSRDKIIAEARRVMPGLEIVDEMTDARGAPDSSLAMVTTALGQLAKLGSGAVALSDNNLAIRGSAPDQATAKAINAAAKSLPQPLRLASIEVSGPAAAATTSGAASPPVAAAPPAPKAAAIPIDRPYRWKGIRHRDVVTLSGSVPSEAARAQLVAAAKGAISSGRVFDQMRLASGLPAGIDFGAATGFAVTQLSQLRSGTARLTDAKLAIEGEALDAAAYRIVSAAVSGTPPGGIKLDSAAVVPPRVANYFWSIKRDGKSLTLAGHFPDEGTRTAMLDGVAHRFADLKLDDKTSIASGAPDGFAAAMGMGLDQLSRLVSGEASIAGGKLDDHRRRRQRADCRRCEGCPLEAGRRHAGGGADHGGSPACSANGAGRGSGGTVDAEDRAGAGRSIGGAVAASDPRRAEGRRGGAGSCASDARTRDRRTICIASAPKPAAPAAAATAVTPPAATGSAAKPPSATPAPATQSPPASVATAPAAKSAPSTAAAIKACTAALAKASRSGRIRFPSSGTEIRPWSRPALDKVIAALKRCPTLRIEVAGYTDVTGTRAFNEKLSKERAAAVVATLVTAGIPADRLTSTGYASQRPIANNRTQAGRARNRRVELTVIE